jgi:RHS repeat-associated protein
MAYTEGGSTTVTYYSYNAGNELTQRRVSYQGGWVSTDYDYDSNGNMIRQTGGFSAPAYFRWDSRDLLSGYFVNFAAPQTDFYRYDGLGSRVSTKESGTLRYYDWDGINVIQEKDASNEVTERQVHGYAPIASVGDIALMDKGGTPYVPVSDQVGTTWGLLDSSGSMASYYEYDAFGVSRGVSESVSNLYRFGTKRLDADPGLYHFIARQYEADLGRFVSRDPACTACDVPSWYPYAGNMPTSSVDWAGLWKIDRNGMCWPGGLAPAESECGDTIDGLALRIGLESSEWSAWLGTPDMISTLDSSKDIPPRQLTAGTYLSGGQQFWIPNTIYAHWAGTGGDIGKLYVRWTMAMLTFWDLGFRVEEDQGGQAAGFNNTIANLSQRRELHGIYFWGHGVCNDPSWHWWKHCPEWIGLLTDATGGGASYISYYVTWHWMFSYKPAFGLLCACGSYTARPFFSSAPGSAFWGAHDTLSPFPPNYWGHVPNVELGCPNVPAILPFGAQGTHQI